MRKATVALASALAVLAIAGLLYRHWRTRNIGRVQRGYEVAQEKGCFTCHGPGGLRGMADPGYGLDEVPALAGGLITMYVQDEAEIREWILDGLPKRIRNDPAQMKLRENALVLMPAWRDYLSERETEDLVAFVKAVSDFEGPPEGPASQGKEVAARFGCFNCHGPQGRGSPPNLRAFKGYIPSWDGADFTELAKNDDEVREWILNGRPKRLENHPVARFFLGRQPIQMPSYRGHVTDLEVEQLLAYIRWVRSRPY